MPASALGFMWVSSNLSVTYYHVSFVVYKF